MLKMDTKKKKSLSDTFMELINPAPLSIDPEIDHSETAAKVVENDDIYEGEKDEEENVPSTLRKRKFDFLEDGNERYTGTKVSRKSLGLSENDSNIEHNEEADDSLLDGNKESDENENSDNQNREDNEEDSEDNEDADDNLETEDGNSSDNPSEEGNFDYEDNDNFQHISKSSDLEVEKGNAVRNQLKLWDSLLECRITLQKTLIAANKLPQHRVLGQFISQGGSKFKSEVQRAKSNITTLLEKFISLQTIMLNSYPETNKLDKFQNETSTETDEEIDSDAEGDECPSDKEDGDEQKEEKHKVSQRSLKEYAKVLGEQHEKYKNYRNATIQKWNDKTRISVGKLSSRNFSSFEQSTLKQVEQVLSNRQRLIERTQLKRSSYNILGEELIRESDKQVEESESLPSADINDMKQSHDNKEYNTEIFDDTDFYHQLLRDLIEKKSSDVTDPIQLGRQWLKLQKLRSKMKRKIDTRATKGRKIRYVIHPKLVNFMAPVEKNNWTEEAKTELFTSLFGTKR